MCMHFPSAQVYTLYNEAVASSFANAAITALFGFAPPAELPGGPPPLSPLVDAGAPRGFEGLLSNVAWRGAAWDVVSNASGVFLLPHGGGG